MQNQTTLKDFEVTTKLGEGAFAEVFKVKRKEDGQIYAMKKIKLNRMKEKQRDNALNQVRILASYNGDNIIGYKQSFYDEPSSTLCIVMEYASGGDILKLIQSFSKKRAKIPQKEVWKALVHITLGVKSLHDKKILHRDLKCANIFVSKDGAFKLGDLNVSKVLKKDMAQTQTGTPYYASPQVWKDKPYGIKSDMWSLGCVIYEMAAQRPPFTATDLPGLYKKICAGHFPRIPMEYSSDLVSVINSLLKLNPKDRPDTTALLTNSTVHRNYEEKLDFEAIEEDLEDQLLKTLKVNHRNLKGIKNILPKSNYEGLKSSRSRANSIEKKFEETPSFSKKPSEKEIKIKQKASQNPPPLSLQRKQSQKQIQKISKNQSQKNISPAEKKSRQAIEKYLQMKRKVNQKERQEQIKRLKQQKECLIKKRQRVLSACGRRNNSPMDSLKKQVLESQKRIEEKPIPSTSRINKKESENKLPPKPMANNSQVNQSYKMPPKPSPLIPRKNSSISSNNNIPSNKQIPKPKESLQRAGERIVTEMFNEKNSSVVKSPKASNRIGRSNSAQKVIYPSWWID